MTRPEPPGRPGIRAALFGAVRLAVFLPADRHAFAPEARVLAALVLLHVVLLVGFQLAQVGFDGQLNLYELPGALSLLTLALICGVACAEVDQQPDLALRLAVAAVALAVVMTVPLGLVGVVLDRSGSFAADPQLGSHFWYAAFAWWAAAIAVAIARLVRASLLGRLRAVAYGLVLLVAPAYWIPAGALWSARYDAAWDAGARGRIGESAFYAQQRLLEQALGALAPHRPGVEDVYVLAAALYASEDVFMKEVRVIAELLEQRFDALGRSVQLVNNPATLEKLPIASMTSIRRALAAIGQRMDPDEDVLVLYVTSHGSDKHLLSVDLWPLELDAVDPGQLRKALDDAGIRWRVIVVSACYSGGYIEPLANDQTLVITAARADRRSFGCGSESDFTYLAKALFDEALRTTFSFEEAFSVAREQIEARERSQGFEPSEPQIRVGAAIRDKLVSLTARLNARAASMPAPRELR